MISNLKLYLIIAAFAASVGSSIYFTAKYKDGQYAIKEQKARDEYIVELQKRQDEYNAKVEYLNKQALKRQTELSNLNSELERKYANANKFAKETLAKYNSLVSNGWRLRDPGTPTNSTQLSRTTSCGDSSTTDSSNGTSCSRELSRETTEFLLQFASDADKVVEQLKVSQEYALKLKQICEK